jgi:hypothetical protein
MLLFILYSATVGGEPQELEVTPQTICPPWAFNRISESSVAVLRWIEANGYRQSGPARELFLRISAPANRDDESNVTEIQVPVEKA